MKRICLIPLILLWGITNAQTSDKRWGGMYRDVDYFSVGLHGLKGSPLGKLKEGNYRKGTRIDAEFFAPSIFNAYTPFAIHLGLHVDVMASGSGREDIVLNTTIPAKYRLYNHSMAMHLIGRISPGSTRARPYIDGIFGFRRFYTTEEIRPNEKHATERNRLISNTTLVYGGSLGIIIRLGDITCLDLRATYSQGSKASYADLDTLQKVGDTMVYSTRQSRTPMLLLQAGIVVILRKYTQKSRFLWSRALES